MLRSIADGVLIHQSRFVQSNAVVVQGSDGVLLIDPGVHDDEMACLANDLQERGLPVVAGFSTHPHWDHLLWDTRLGTAPRFGTARALKPPGSSCRVGWRRSRRPPVSPTRCLSTCSASLPDCPSRRRRSPGMALGSGSSSMQRTPRDMQRSCLRSSGVLVAGDMVSDLLIPLLDFNDTADPIADYLAGLELLEGMAAEIDVFVPGHGSIGGRDQLHARIELDRAYVQSLRDADALSDPRLDPSADSRDWLPGVHARQLQRLAERSERGTPG